MSKKKTTFDVLEKLVLEQFPSMRSFLDEYYRQKVYSGADKDELDKHEGRYSKGKTRAHERIASLFEFFNEEYRKDGIHTPADRDAAWSMYVELDSRIATQDFLYGDVNSALSSLAALFSLNREISKQYGHRCRRYYALTNDQFNEHLRPFTSKYHEKISKGEGIAPDEFKAELTIVQGKLKELKDELFEIAR
ncbi:hypothetical protein [Thalassolituus marinus]|uniref:Uncharacterized protein n=1 Tax=Thalassolituus marinus TaxID=671053 RepID=A0ABS7ZVW1_9GAMM|nr:hypothetical protein [Thalassolituus marinus]MCA6064535.1 hypothetical protein [Thalassolituus marinus]